MREAQQTAGFPVTLNVTQAVPVNISLDGRQHMR
jgi:hypothetical protein